MNSSEREGIENKTGKSHVKRIKLDNGKSLMNSYIFNEKFRTDLKAAFRFVTSIDTVCL